MEPYRREWRVTDVLANYERLGVPHFQRGLIWGDDSKSLLLESLYYGTPCGTFILWKPRLPSEEGVPLGASRAMDLLIVDGQQRIRTLHEIFGDHPSHVPAEMAEDADEGAPGEHHEREGIWCVNLCRIKEISGLLDDSLSRYPLFWRVRDPLGSKRPRFKYNLLPLRLLVAGERTELLRYPIKPSGTAVWDRGSSDQMVSGILERLRTLRNHEFPVILLEESQDQFTLAEVVAMYNRINTAGERVTPEERAFATLVSLYRPASDWLRNTFEEVHGPVDPRRGEKEKDVLLRRQKERAFGFKLFIRVFVQVCTYHFNLSLGANAMSFDVLQSHTVQKWLADPSKKDVVKFCFDQTRKIIVSAEKILTDGLGLDALKFLPDTFSLVPLIQVLIRYPAAMEGGAANPYWDQLMLLTLKLLLVERTAARDTLNLALEVNRQNTLCECLDSLESLLTLPPSALKERLPRANSLQDRYVLLLYALLRKREARDFSYANIPDENRRRAECDQFDMRAGSEVILSESVVPEKQHLVPHARLRDILGLRDASRRSSGPENNIGNISYISHKLNSFCGLGEVPINLGEEGVRNLRSHFLLDPDQDVENSRLPRLYAKAVADTTGSGDRERAYSEFCTRRRELIADAFESWVGELSSRRKAGPRIEPNPPLEYRTVHDNIRAMNYSDNVEDLLIKFTSPRVKEDRRAKDRSGEPQVVLRIEAKKGDYARARLTRDSIVIEIKKGSVFWEQLGEATRGDFERGNGRKVFDPTSDQIKDLEAILEWLSGSLGPDRPAPFR
jgi:hypothetical protein